MARKKKTELGKEDTKLAPVVKEVKEVKEVKVLPAVEGKTFGKKELKDSEIAFECIVEGGLIFSRTCVEFGEVLIFKKADDRDLVKNLIAKKHFLKAVKSVDDRKFYRF